MPSVYTTAKPTKTASFASISSDGTIGGRPGLLPARPPSLLRTPFTAKTVRSLFRPGHLGIYLAFIYNVVEQSAFAPTFLACSSS